MKALILALTLATLPLAGCASIGLPPSAVVPGRLTVKEDQAYAQALNAYNALAESYLIAAPSLPKPVKDKAKAASRTAIKALNAADTARRAGNAPDFLTQITLATQATTEFRTLLPKGR